MTTTGGGAGVGVYYSSKNLDKHKSYEDKKKAFIAETPAIILTGSLFGCWIGIMSPVYTMLGLYHASRWQLRKYRK
jgi:hypothetical protein